MLQSGAYATKLLLQSNEIAEHTYASSVRLQPMAISLIVWFAPTLLCTLLCNPSIPELQPASFPDSTPQLFIALCIKSWGVEPGSGAKLQPLYRHFPRLLTFPSRVWPRETILCDGHCYCARVGLTAGLSGEWWRRDWTCRGR